MSLRRSVSLGGSLLILLVLAACSSNSPTQSELDNSIEVDLSTFPDSGDPVPNQTIPMDAHWSQSREGGFRHRHIAHLLLA